MKLTSITTLFILFSISLVGCGGVGPDTHAKLLDEELQVRESILESMKKVKDVKTANDAAEEIRSAFGDLEDIYQRSEALGSFESQADYGDVRRKYKERSDTLQEAFLVEVKRIEKLDAEARDPIRNVMKDTPESEYRPIDWL